MNHFDAWGTVILDILKIGFLFIPAILFIFTGVVAQEYECQKSQYRDASLEAVFFFVLACAGYIFIAVSALRFWEME